MDYSRNPLAEELDFGCLGIPHLAPCRTSLAFTNGSQKPEAQDMSHLLFGALGIAITIEPLPRVFKTRIHL